MLLSSEVYDQESIAKNTRNSLKHFLHNTKEIIFIFILVVKTNKAHNIPRLLIGQAIIGPRKMNLG